MIQSEDGAMEFQDIKQLITSIVGEMRTAQAELIRDVMGQMLHAHQAHAQDIMKAHQGDHDSLVRLTVLNEQMARDVNDIKLANARQVQENEKRIRELEATRWKLAGYLGVLAIVTPIIASFLIHWLFR